MTTDQLTYNGTLVRRTCWCGIRHAIPEELDRELRRNPKQGAYCPVGHSYVHAGPSLDKILERERGEARTRERALRDQLDAERRSKAAVRGALTKAKKRAGAGVCPAPGCKRHFANLQRHVASKHPDFMADA